MDATFSPVLDAVEITADEVNEESFGDKDDFMHDDKTKHKISPLSYTLVDPA